MNDHNKNLPDKVKEALEEKLFNFEQFETIAHQQLPKFSDNIRKAVEQSLEDPTFREKYDDLLVAYNKAVKEMNVTSPDALVSEEVIKKATKVSEERGIEIERKSKKIRNTTSTGSSKEVEESDWSVKIDSKFPLAIGGLISKLVELF